MDSANLGCKICDCLGFLRSFAIKSRPFSKNNWDKSYHVLLVQKMVQKKSSPRLAVFPRQAHVQGNWAVMIKNGRIV